MLEEIILLLARVTMKDSKEKVANVLHQEVGGGVPHRPLRGGNNQGALHFKKCSWVKMMKTI